MFDYEDLLPLFLSIFTELTGFIRIGSSNSGNDDDDKTSNSDGKKISFKLKEKLFSAGGKGIFICPKYDQDRGEPQC
jgi:hypothetical protein